MKIFILIEHGSCIGVYSDDAKAEAEVIDLDSLDEAESEHAQDYADQIQATYARID